jgi:hypothetical protein
MFVIFCFYNDMAGEALLSSRQNQMHRVRFGFDSNIELGMVHALENSG